MATRWMMQTEECETCAAGLGFVTAVALFHGRATLSPECDSQQQGLETLLVLHCALLQGKAPKPSLFPSPSPQSRLTSCRLSPFRLVPTPQDIMQVLHAHRITRAVRLGPSCIRQFAASSVALRLPASACQHTRSSSVYYPDAATPSSSTTTCHLEGHAGEQMPAAMSTMQQTSFPSRQYVALAAAACAAVTASCLLFAGPAAAAAAASGAAAASSHPAAGQSRETKILTALGSCIKAP